MSEKNYFSELAKINVSNYVEKKGQFSYLSWAWAVDQIKRYDPDASWETRWFKDINGVELPYALGPNGAFVQVSVTVKGKTHSNIQPIMDFKNKSVMNPDAMDVNKAIQRCLVKAIALHGLGLYIYAGEDLPNDLVSGIQIQAIEAKAQEFADLRGGTMEKTITALGVGSIDHLTGDQAVMVLDKLAAWIKKAQEDTTKAEAPEKQAQQA